MGIIYGDPASTSGYGMWMPVYCQSDAESPVAVDIAVTSSGTSPNRLTLAIHPTVGMDDDALAFLNGAKLLQCEAGTMGTDTASTVVAGSSGGSVARTSFATTTTNARRVRVTTSSLIGTYDAYLWWKRASSGDTIKGQLRWGFGSSATDQETNVGSQETLQAVVANNGYAATKLGRVYAPEEAGTLSLSLYLERTAGLSTVDADYIFFVPTNPEDAVVKAYDPSATFNGKTVRFTEEGRVYQLTAGSVDRSLAVEGRAGQWFKPGLNLLGVFGENTASGLSAFVGDTYSVRCIYSPRYYS